MSNVMKVRVTKENGRYSIKFITLHEIGMFHTGDPHKMKDIFLDIGRVINGHDCDAKISQAQDYEIVPDDAGGEYIFYVKLTNTFAKGYMMSEDGLDSMADAIQGFLPEYIREDAGIV